jgi:2,4-dienoyl-CoA reductase-like NADH-dependent reductase (Old Yellow Enzyme family)
MPAAAAPSLFSPLSIRGRSVRNRLWVSPMCQWMAGNDGVARPWHVVNYGQYAAGGAGLVVVEATAISPAGRIATGDLGLWDDAQVDGLRQVVTVIVQGGAVPAIQIGHAGRKGSAVGVRWTDTDPTFAPDAPEQWTTVAPSPVPNTGLPVPRELTIDEIGGIVEEFAAAARRAVTAGFQVLEIHAAHGYLLHQFLSPISNRRTDVYGGSLAGRARLLREVVRAVRAEVGAGIVLFTRVSATDWIDGGWGLEETIEVSRWIAQDGVDLLDVSTGGMDNPAVPVGPGYQVPYAAALRQATGLPVSAVGMISEPNQAAQILITGQADAVMCGRAWMRNPHLGAAWAAALGVSDLHGIVAPPYSMARWGK